MSDYWFTADWHLGHERIIELANRPFDSVAEMNEAIIERHNAVVRPGDRLWVLGDACMGPLDESLALVRRFNGERYLIAGNHDRCFHGYGDNRVNRAQLDAAVARYRRAGFALVVTGAHIRRNGFGSLVELEPTTLGTGNRRHYGITGELCHFPTVGESDPDRPDRFAEYRPRPLGGVDRRPKTRRWVVCGHVHGAWLTRARNVNVGVDQWNFGPVHQDELSSLITSMEQDYGTRLDDRYQLTTPGPGPRRTIT